MSTSTIPLIGPDQAGRIFSPAWQKALGGTVVVTEKATGERLFESGLANAADVKTFTDVPIVDSNLTLKSYLVTDLPEIAAIELIPKHP